MIMISKNIKCRAEVISDYKKIYNLIPLEAGQVWKISLFELKENIPAHYHRIQTQLMMVLNGKLNLKINDKFIKCCEGSFIAIPPNTAHEILLDEQTTFLTIDIPGFNFPEDVYVNEKPTLQITEEIFTCHSQTEARINSQMLLKSSLLEELKSIKKIPEQYYISKIEKDGFTVYSLCENETAWSIAIIDVIKVQEHYHKFGSEHFIVLNGEMEITLNGKTYKLKAGQSVHVPANIKHKIKSVSSTPVRFLCVNFPSFEENNFYEI